MRSIKSRLVLVSSVVLVLFMILTAVALEKAVTKRALQAQKDQLQLQIYGLLAAVDRDKSGQSLTVAEGRLFEASLLTAQSGLYALLLEEDGTAAWKSHSLTIDLPRPVVSDGELGDWQFDILKPADLPYFRLIFSMQWPDRQEHLKPYRVVMWQDASDYFSQLERFRQTLWTWLIVTTILLLIVIYLIMSWSLKPLVRVGEEVKAIEDRNQTGFENDYPTELAPLTENLNILLQREQYQRQKYRHAMDDLAHSLKTPLAVLRGLSESGKLKTGSDETLAEQVDRMNQIVSYQLQKASQVGDVKISKPIDLIPQINKVLSAMEKVYRDKNVKVSISIPQHIMLRMDEGDCLEIIGNIIDNAFKYGQSCINIMIKNTVENRVKLTVEDDGKGLNDSEINLILNRGTRLDETNEGQGIGLAVVAEITKSYAMELQFGRSQKLGGLKVELDFHEA